ncbi:MAG: helix-turn-helix domain-containing protein [Acidimicrobiia bacterium]
MPQPISAESRQLDRTIGDLTSALGDPTRRAIFIAVRESGDPMTSSDVAILFGIHANVARHHLDKLAADGYLRISHRRQNGRTGPGAGRPAKCYESTSKEIDLHFPSRRADVLIELLLRIVAKAGVEDLPSVAEAVGREYGREIASEIGSPDERGYDEAVKAVAEAMTGVGFHMSPDLDGHRLLTSFCPFGDAATGHPDVVCSLDRGMVGGLFELLSQGCEPILHPAPADGDTCITEVPVSITSR